MGPRNSSYQSDCSRPCLGHRSMTAPAHQTRSAFMDSMRHGTQLLQNCTFEKTLRASISPEGCDSPYITHFGSFQLLFHYSNIPPIYSIASESFIWLKQRARRAFPSSPRRGRKPVAPSWTAHAQQQDPRLGLYWDYRDYIGDT